MENILIVGHCNFDGPILADMVKEYGNSVRLDTLTDVQDFLKNNTAKLMLVNRIFNNGEKGLTFIEKMHNEHPEIKLMLISNFPEAQEEAKKFNSEGFGKADLEKGKQILKDFFN